jgi:hypothetical protein
LSFELFMNFTMRQERNCIYKGPCLLIVTSTVTHKHKIKKKNQFQFQNLTTLYTPLYRYYNKSLIKILSSLHFSFLFSFSHPPFYFLFKWLRYCPFYFYFFLMFITYFFNFLRFLMHISS